MATVKFKGSPLTLVGNEPALGQTAPNCKEQKSADLSDYTLATGAGETRILTTVLSPDTPACELETKRFTEELSWPRVVRPAVSDPQVSHESTDIHGRGTAEAKTNDVTNRVTEGDAGFVVKFGRE